MRTNRLFDQIDMLKQIQLLKNGIHRSIRAV